MFLSGPGHTTGSHPYDPYSLVDRRHGWAGIGGWRAQVPTSPALAFATELDGKRQEILMEDGARRPPHGGACRCQSRSAPEHARPARPASKTSPPCLRVIRPTNYVRASDPNGQRLLLLISGRPPRPTMAHRAKKVPVSGIGPTTRCHPAEIMSATLSFACKQ
jgi:hypothetical protein